MYIFQQFFILPLHPWNKTKPNPPWVPSTPNKLVRSDLSISKSFESYGNIKKYADSRSTAPHLLRLLVRIQPGHGCLSIVRVVYFEGYCWKVFNCLGRIKKYAESGTGNNIHSFQRLLLARVQLPEPHKNMPIVDSNQHTLFPKATASTCSNVWTA